MEKRRRDPALFTVGLLLTVGLHAGVFGFLWLTRSTAQANKPPGIGTFVDAQLVRFGKPRDLKFLPHKQGVVKRVGPAEGIKVAKDMSALPRLDKDPPPPDKIDPLKNTHAEMFKNINDQPEGMEDTQVGSATGSKAGTATEAKGDPYILALIDQIGSAWTVPTTIKEAELANLSADACLTINGAGVLTHAEVTRHSGNSQFDSSLEGTLNTIKKLPPPPERFAAAAARGRLCPTFSKQ